MGGLWSDLWFKSVMLWDQYIPLNVQLLVFLGRFFQYFVPRACVSFDGRHTSHFTRSGHQLTGKGDIGSKPLLWRTVLCFSPAIQVLGFNTPQLYWWVWEIERRPFVHCAVYPRVVDRAPQWVITSSMTPSAAFKHHRWNSAYGNLLATACASWVAY